MIFHKSIYYRIRNAAGDYYMQREGVVNHSRHAWTMLPEYATEWHDRKACERRAREVGGYVEIRELSL